MKKLLTLTIFALLLMSNTIYLPLTYKTSQTMVGVESEGNYTTLDQYYNPRTNLKISIRWADVERVRGQYDWYSIDRKLGDYRPTWISVKTTPPWALDEDDPICKLPPKEYWGAFHQFVQAVINRYHPEFIEIWNEPNVSYDDMNHDHAHLYGCIGDGELYGEFSEKLYLNTTGAKIIIGAVNALDTNFLEGMLDEAKDKFDGVSYHCYEWYYDGQLGDTCRETYLKFQALTTKPVYLSETAVYYHSGDDAGYYHAQIDYYEQLKSLPTVWFWYTLGYNGWPETISTDMVGLDGPREIWYVYAAE